MNTLAARLSVVVLLAAWVAVFAAAWNDSGAQFDFKTYYVAAHTWETGEDPYDVSVLRDVGRQPHLLPFYYPLSSLYLFRPIGSLDYPAAHRAWLVIKALGLAALLLVWKRVFLASTGWPLLLLAALLAFNAAMVWDIQTGNIAVLEQVCLWAGLAFFVARRMTAFTACIVLASTAKLMPAVFLLLLWHPAVRSRANSIRFAAGTLAVAAIALVPFLASPQYLGPFLRGFADPPPRFQTNPTVVALIGELSRGHDEFPAWLSWVLAAVWYGVVLAASLRLLRAACRDLSLRVVALVAAIAYAMFAPRLIVYSYMIVIVPALALVFPAMKDHSLRKAALVVALCIGGLRVLPGTWGGLLASASPLILLVMCWLVLIDLEKAGGLGEAP
jgi:hypothetical protein